MFEDDKVFDLGSDETGRRLHEIVRRTLKGRYYPPDAVRVTGRFALEDRAIREGDRLVQKAPLFCRMGGPLISSAVEVFVAEQTPTSFSFGYVTTAWHMGRGIWRADFVLRNGRLELRVKSTSMPQSWLFWLGLPVARFLQLRARRRAVEEFLVIEATLL